MRVYKIVVFHDGELLGACWRMLAPKLRVVYKEGEWVSGPYPLFAFDSISAAAQWRQDAQLWVATAHEVRQAPMKVVGTIHNSYAEQLEKVRRYWEYHAPGTAPVPLSTVLCDKIRLERRMR